MAIRRGRLLGCLVLLAPTLAALNASEVSAAAGDVTTFAGTFGEGPGRQVAQRVRSMAGRGSVVYMGDETRHVVRAMDAATGVQRIIAGNGSYDGHGPDAIGDGGPARSASLGYVSALALDAAGHLYIADSFHFRIRKLEPSGRISIVAGNGTEGDAGDGGPARDASLKYIWGMGFDGAGNLYVSTNSRIRRIDTAGTITTVAGIGTVDVDAGSSPDGIPATEAQINSHGLAVDAAGNFYFGDGLSLRVRKVGTDGILRTLANVCGTGMVLDPAGDLYVSGCNRVLKIDPAGRSAVAAGTGGYASAGDGGPAASASLKAPESLALDGAGRLYIADVNDYRVRRVDGAGIIDTVAGNGTFSYSGDGGPATSAQLDAASGVAVDTAGNVYVADWANQRVRRVDGAGIITTVAGTGVDASSGDGGPATAAAVSYPSELAVDAAGNLYIASYLGFRVRKVDVSGVISTVAGNGTRGYTGDGGPAKEASIGWIGGLAVDPSGNLYIADTGSHRVRKVASDGTISTVAGTGVTGFSGDGGPASEARLYNPNGLAVDGAGNLFIADTYNGRVRRVSVDGTISTVANTGFPLVVESDRTGGLFVGDYAKVVRVTPAGSVVVAGNGFRGFSGDGGPATQAMFGGFSGLAYKGTDLYIADSQNARVRKVASADLAVPATTTTTTIASTTTSTSPTTTTTAPTTTTTSTTRPPTTTTTTTIVPKPVGLKNPYAVWSQPAATPLDGIGTWLATANDPVAGPDHAAPAYLYGHVFAFTGSAAWGTVGLATTPSGKMALFSVKAPDGTSPYVAVPFNWSAGRFYFPLVHQLAPGLWGAWVYDHAVSTWVPIGQLALAPEWGKLAATSITTVAWSGTNAAACAAYPVADVLAHAAYGFAGGSIIGATLTDIGSGPGDCPSRATVEAGGWARLRVPATV